MAAMMTGCTTIYGGGRTEAEARSRMEAENLRATVARLESRLDELEMGRQDVYRRMETLERGVQGDLRTNTERLQLVEKRLGAEEAARQQDRQAIIEDLSGKMAELLNTRSGGARRSERGLAHVVGPGQTLSEIAKVYGVRTRVIQDANDLADPNSIRVGQTLFIPE